LELPALDACRAVMEINRHGCTRIVLIGRSRVYKLPNFLSGWKLFLTGLLANMQEASLGSVSLPGLCPVLWSIPGGWLVVMRRARVMTEDEFMTFDVAAFCERLEYAIPVEHKSNSFGYLGGSIVAIDYGS
jgi:hypothetical protein